MGGIIHLESENVQTIISKMKLDVKESQAQLDSLKRSINLLSMNWFGGSSKTFLREARNFHTTCDTKFEELSTLIVRAQHEVDEWLEVDSRPWENIQIGLFDRNRDLLESYIIGDTSIATLMLTIVNIPFISDLFILIGDVAGGISSFMSWVVADWDKYERMGQEIAAFLFDTIFFSIRMAPIMQIDAFNLISEISNIVPVFGQAVDMAIDYASWGINTLIGLSSDVQMELFNSSGIKDLFVNSIEGMVNTKIDQFELGFDRSITQILTAPA